MGPTAAAAVTALGVVAVAGALTAGRRAALRPVSPEPTRTAWSPRSLTACCDALDGPVDPALAARCYLAAALGGPTLLWVVAGPALAAGAAGALAALPRLALPALRRRRTVRRDALLAPYLEGVASSIRSGRSVRVAVVSTARAADAPLAADLAPLADALDHGASLEEALAHWASAPTAGREVRLAAAALQLGARAGGEVARAVDGVAATLRERQEVHGEVVALATQARTSVGLLVVAPLGFAALVSTIEPDAVAFLVGTPVGWACLVGGLALDALGAVWMQRIVRRPG